MFRFLLFILLLLNSINFAQAKLETLVSAGLDYSYNFKFDKAEEIFNKVIDEFPHYPHGYHYLSQLHLWAYLGSKDEQELKSFKTHSELAKIKGENLFDEDDENAELSYMLGAIYTLQATSQSFTGSSLDAFWAAKSAVSNYENTIDLDPEFYDAYLGLGLFNYALSYVPGVFKWAISISGLSYDKELGLEYLRVAYQKGTRDKIEAAFHLSKIYTDYVAEYDSAAVLLNDLLERFPNNSLFHYQYAVLNIKARNLDEAEKSLAKVISLNHPKFYQTNSLSSFLLGDIYFKRNKFEKAITHYKKFITTTRDIDYTGIANFRMALSSSMLGDSTETAERMRLARIGNLDIPDDIYAHEKSIGFIEAGVPEDYKKVYIAKNNVEAKNSLSAYNSLIQFADSIKSEEVRGMAYFYLSEAAYDLQKYDIAIEYSKKAAEINYEDEQWVLPYAAYITAKSNYSIGNFALSREYLEIAENNNEFDYKESIEALVNNLTRKLNIL